MLLDHFIVDHAFKSSVVISFSVEVNDVLCFAIELICLDLSYGSWLAWVVHPFDLVGACSDHRRFVLLQALQQFIRLLACCEVVVRRNSKIPRIAVVDEQVNVLDPVEFIGRGEVSKSLAFSIY